MQSASSGTRGASALLRCSTDRVKFTSTSGGARSRPTLRTLKPTQARSVPRALGTNHLPQNLTHGLWASDLISGGWPCPSTFPTLRLHSWHFIPGIGIFLVLGLTQFLTDPLSASSWFLYIPPASTPQPWLEPVYHRGPKLLVAACCC